ncbi:unnamed protein product [Parascedosporium putredinis]|uniref:Sodium/calcium exchanger membrane region domain-containing protein n=1 Tax=Parascedosporium putredinis TaxID=1442378 RepID=A0A9P1HB42_9PEZI|nr:unnamed protein product [Parascedosporium putredinis]CAI8001930.1 unnamed protein product [Parascedosporium putredinis]
MFHSWVNVLLIFVPVGIAVEYVPGIHGGVVFAINCIAIVPLAGLLSHATESVAVKLGDTVGALLNVTFGNANQIRIVQASLLGSILANLLLILGMCFFLGGLRFREQIYNSTVTQMSACLLSLSVISLVLPTAFHASFSDMALADDESLKISRICSIILLLVYLVYLLFQLKSHSYMYESTPQHIVDAESTPGPAAAWLDTSSSDSSSSSSSSSSDDSSDSNPTVRKKMKKAIRRARRSSSSSSSSDSEGTANSKRTAKSRKLAAAAAVGEASQSGGKLAIVDDSSEDEAPTKRRRRHIRRKRSHKHKSKRKQAEKEARDAEAAAAAAAGGAVPTAAADEAIAGENDTRRVDFAVPDDDGLRRASEGGHLTPVLAVGRLPSGTYRHASRARAPDGADRRQRGGGGAGRIPEDRLSTVASVVLLLVSTALVALCAEFVVGSIEEVVEGGAIREAFIGLIILPVVGNAAEHVTAITVAMKNKMDLAIGVAVGSSIQIALFVTPLVVILGWCMQKEMTLYFTLFETVCLFVSAFIVNFLVLDGRSNYLEGALLMCTYAIISVVAFYYPNVKDASELGGNSELATMLL